MKPSKIWGLVTVLAAVGVLVFLFPFEESKETSRSYTAYYAAENSLESGDLTTAHEQATELLNTAQRWKGNWNYGNAIHDAHTVLGKIALKRGNIQEAKLELLLAGDTPGSPQLNSFGPRTDLAEELLKAGEREVVLAYFDKCAKFWELGGADLNNWRAEVKAGKIPDFENAPRLNRRSSDKQ